MAAIPVSNDSNRRYPRLKLEVPVRVMANRGEKVLIIQARGNELNEGGLAISTGFELTLDDSVAIEFTTPFSKTPLRARAIVRNRHNNRYGLEFITRADDKWGNSAELRALLENATRGNS